MNVYTENDVTRIVRKKLGLLYSNGFSKFEISLQLGISEKTLYKWEHGTIPKANFYLNLLSLCNKVEDTSR